MDPGKSEVIFERFNLICESFRKLLDSVYRRTSLRSPSLDAVEFFPSEEQASRLPSPPPSSPILASRNVFSVGADRGCDSRVASGLPSNNTRQTRLDEYRSRFTPTGGVGVQTTTASESILPGQPGDGPIRSIIRSFPGMDGIDLTHGIVSSRHPRQIILPLSDIVEPSTQVRSARDIPVDCMTDYPTNTVMDIREFAKKFTSPSTPTLAIKTSPTTPRPRKSRKINLSPQFSQTPAPPRTPIKTRSISESPGHPSVLGTSLNPWTIAATTNQPAKRPRSTIYPQSSPSTSSCQPISAQDSARPLDITCNPWVNAGLVDRSSNRRSTATCPGNETEMDAFRGDIELHMVVVVWDVSMENVITGVERLLRFVAPPECDLTAFLLQYRS